MKNSSDLTILKKISDKLLSHKFPISIILRLMFFPTIDVNSVHAYCIPLSEIED